MSKDVAQYIYDLVKNDDYTDERLMLKDLYKNRKGRYSKSDDIAILRINHDIKTRIFDGNTSYMSLYNHYILKKDNYAVISENDVTPKNGLYVCKIINGKKKGQIVYLKDELAQKIIKQIAIPLDLKVFICERTWDYCHTIILSWDHWEK
jgi:hypothetical protein